MQIICKPQALANNQCNRRMKNKIGALGFKIEKPAHMINILMDIA